MPGGCIKEWLASFKKSISWRWKIKNEELATQRVCLVIQRLNTQIVESILKWLTFENHVMIMWSSWYGTILWSWQILELYDYYWIIQNHYSIQSLTKYRFVISSFRAVCNLKKSDRYVQIPLKSHVLDRKLNFLFFLQWNFELSFKLFLYEMFHSR